MVVYIYDGSFDGLLTSIYDAYYLKEKPEQIFKEEDFTPNFLYNSMYITTDKNKCEKVYNAVINKLSRETLENIFYVYLSDLKDSSTLIYNYIKLGFKIGSEVNLHKHNEVIIEIYKIKRRVTLEAHRLKGFIRFRQINNFLLYSTIEPDHNIMSLITPHFINRFPNENWIIHDTKREIAGMYNGQECVISPLSILKGRELLKGAKDSLYEDLWKNYFNSTTIEERINPRLQKRCVPTRYWKHMLEF